MRQEKIGNADMAKNQMEKTQNTTHQFTNFLPSLTYRHDETQPHDKGGRFEVKLTTYRHLLDRDDALEPCLVPT